MKYKLCETTVNATAARLAAALVIARVDFRYSGEAGEPYSIWIYESDRLAAHQAAMLQEVEVSL